MYSETLTAKEQDANNFLSVAGSTYYSFTEHFRKNVQGNQNDGS